MKIQVIHLLFFLCVAYSVIFIIIFISPSFLKKFSISSREELEKFIDLKDSVIKNLKSEIVNLKSTIANLEFESNALSQKLEEIESL